MNSAAAVATLHTSVFLGSVYTSLVTSHEGKFELDFMGEMYLLKYDQADLLPRSVASLELRVTHSTTPGCSL
jgi:hypothetical protein